MSDEAQTPVEPVTDDLDAFSADFFGQKDATQEDTTKSPTEDIEDVEPESDALQDSAEDTEEIDEGLEPLEAEKPKKSRYQERISELTKLAREAERERDELRQKLEAPKTEEPAPTTVVLQGPSPQDTNEDGSDKYPLGEFDPAFIRDLTRHTLAEEREALKQETVKEAEKAQEVALKTKLTEAWNEKLAPAQERYPDFHEKGENLSPVFEKIDGKYSEYIAATIMDMEFGPDVLYYLASNVDEAEKILAGGPTKATIALGRLESKFAFADEAKQKARPKLSNAPIPPEHTNRGTAVAETEADDYTDDLDAFAKKFFKKRRGT